MNEEMNENKNKLCQFQSDLENFKQQLKNPEVDEFWLPKFAAFTSWSRYVYHYFSLNAFQYFIAQEFLADNRFSKDKSEHLMEFYAYCIKFNNETQAIEDKINEKRKELLTNQNELNLCVQQGCDKIFEIYQKYNMKIICHFNQFFSTE